MGGGGCMPISTPTSVPRSRRRWTRPETGCSVENHGDPGSLTLVSDVDAFVAVARTSIDTGDGADGADRAGPTQRRDRFRVNLFMDPTGGLLTTDHVAVPD